VRAAKLAGTVSESLGKDIEATSLVSTLIWRPTRDPGVRHFFLERTDPDAGVTPFESTTERCSIGSAPGNDLVLADPTVSRFHCEIHVERGSARVRDLESRNGTLLDGVVVRDAYLRAGSVLQLGRVALRFRPSDRSTSVLLSSRTELGSLVGRSAPMRACFAMLERAAASDVVLLLEGETGTGKSQAARAVHALGARAERPFLTVDCGALPPNLVESELFGHRRGAFTGASEDREGVFEAAEGGTVFLDEVGELPLEIQPKLLKALEDGEVRRVGTNAYRPVNVRIIAATNRDLRAEVNRGRMRADLYYRLAVVRVTLPPLRQRPEDIGPVAERMLQSLGVAPAEREALLTKEFVARLEGSAWPGNARELRNHLERCLVFDDALEPAAGEGTGEPARGEVDADARLPFAEARRRAIERFEASYVRGLLDLHHGNVPRAAEAAGVDRTYVYRLMRRHKKDG
jgi:DNA-binding NtrC family response regulator